MSIHLEGEEKYQDSLNGIFNTHEVYGRHTWKLLLEVLYLNRPLGKENPARIFVKIAALYGDEASPGVMAQRYIAHFFDVGYT